MTDTNRYLADKTQAALPYIAFIMLVFGARLCLIAYGGSISPFWDQWGVEANNLYRPWIEGTFEWSSLFSSHNQHRIFTTRLLDLLIFELNNGIWNPILQMVVNAAIQVFALLLLVHFLKTIFRTSRQFNLFCFAGIFFALPFGFENTLWGFCIQFYFVLLFGFIFLWAIAKYSPFTLLWLLGVLSGVLCFLSFSIGALAYVAAIGLIAVRWITKIDRSKRALWALALMILLVSLFLTVTLNISGNADINADSLLKIAYAILLIIEWPCNFVLLPCMLVYLLIQWRRKRSLLPPLVIPFAVHVPMVRFVVRQIIEPPKLKDTSWFLFSMCLWIAGIILAISYGRSDSPLTWRYNDFFCIGVILNFACLELWQQHTSNKKKTLPYLALAWLVIIALGLTTLTPLMITKITSRAKTGTEQATNIRAYLASGYFSHLQNKPAFAISYPNADWLKLLLDNKTIRNILPKALNPKQTKQEPKPIQNTVRFLLNNGLSIMLFGVLLYFLYFLVHQSRKKFFLNT